LFNLGHAYIYAASREPDLIAIVESSGREISFSELTTTVARGVELLTELGAKKGDVVSISAEKSIESIALLISCIFLGCPYVFVDPESPTERLISVLRRCEPSLFFSSDPLTLNLANLPEPIKSVAIVDFFANQSGGSTPADLEVLEKLAYSVDGSSIAYIMFTSGSTGEPKGVAVTHQNVLHFINWGRGRFSITPKDRLASVSPFYFDNSVFDIFVGLFSGASLFLVPKKFLGNVKDISLLLQKSKCTIWFSVPSTIIYLMVSKVFVPSTLPRLRTLIFGGEGFAKPLLHKLFLEFNKDSAVVDFVNVYGPTETTCICSSHTISAEDFIEQSDLVPLGTLNENFSFEILPLDIEDPDFGELVLLGPNVAAGYFNDSARSEQRFSVSQDLRTFGKRAYRTGDVVQLVGNKFYFRGRVDNQIKHLGYRIELEEIDAAFSKIDGVSFALAVYLRDRPEFGRICVALGYSGSLDSAQLLRESAKFLPEYMIPRELRILKDPPTTSNGKLDRGSVLDLFRLADGVN
jgi:D-alanine--poly(phosphoribitol) ligase subunit 1